METDVRRRETSLRRRAGRALLASLAVVLVGTTSSASGQSDVVAIVNQGNPVSELSLAEVRHFFRGDRKRWKHSGETIQVLLPRPGSAEMTVVVAKIFQMGSVSELGQYYMAAIYQQKLTESPPTASAEESVRVVSRSKNALALVRRSVATSQSGIKIIEVDGL